MARHTIEVMKALIINSEFGDVLFQELPPSDIIVSGLLIPKRSDIFPSD
jgi:hypothetical protein